MKVVKIFVLTAMSLSIIACKSTKTITQGSQTQVISVNERTSETVVSESINEGPVFLTAEEMPLFEGKPADEAFTDYVTQNIIWSKEMSGMSGPVYVEFIIETDGSVSNAIVKQGVHSLGRNNSLLDTEALRIINSSSSKWTPAKQRGNAVRLKYTQLVLFR